MNKNYTFIKQKDQPDCKVACLLAIIKQCNGTGWLKKHRELSGTTKQGTSMLGLYKATQQCNFKEWALQTKYINRTG